MCELLEDRTLLSLLGVGAEIVPPDMMYDSVGYVTYEAATQTFRAESMPMVMRLTEGGPILFIQPTQELVLEVQIDNAGQLLADADGDNLVIKGHLDVDGDGVADYGEVLLTGQVEQFGYIDSGTNDTYDFRFTPTGGDLLEFFQVKDIGLVVNSPSSTFAGSFAEDFGGRCHGLVGAIAPASMLSGFVYVDADNDGEVGAQELAIEGVAVTVQGTDYLGNQVSLTDVTDSDGLYSFAHLRPGTYTITESQPSGYDDGLDTLGTAGGTAGNDAFANIALADGIDGLNYNFGERGGTVTGGQTATIGFWQNKNGQELLKSVGGSLGAWLAQTFPNMYGVDAGDRDLSGMTNEQVAQFYRDMFKAKAKRKGKTGPAKLDCQVMAVAFGAYVTSSNLAGNVATQYGFLVTEHGVGIASFNVGSAGAAFGVEDDTEMSVLAMLLATNDQAVLGELYYQMDAALRSMANDVYTAINEAGDI